MTDLLEILLACALYGVLWLGAGLAVAVAFGALVSRPDNTRGRE